MYSADVLLTSDQRLIVEAIDQICATTATEELKLAWDREQRFPSEAMNALAEGGWASLAVSPEYGGQGASAADLAVADGRTLGVFPGPILAHTPLRKGVDVRKAAPDCIAGFISDPRLRLGESFFVEHAGAHFLH